MLFDEVFKNPKWTGQDDFPSTNQWKYEINKWLIFLEEKGQIDRFKPRLNSLRTQRDETLAEISSAYIMENHLKYPIIKWEEKTVNNKDVEFVIKYFNDKIYCEVKSPGWESELSQSERLSRKKLHKYLHAETRTYSLVEPIKKTIDKAYSKFIEKYKNLLIINDDFFINILDDELDIEIALYDNKSGYFSNNKYSNLGGILVINFFQSNKIEYKCKFFKNNYSKNTFNIEC